MFVIGLIPLSYTLLKMNSEYQIGNGQLKKTNHFLFIDNLKLYINSEGG